MGGRGPLPATGRLIFGLSGVVYGRRFAAAAAIAPGDRLLDLGCGCAAVAAAVRQRLGGDALTVGADLSRAMLAQARRRGQRAPRGRVELVRASAVRPPFRDASFDVVLLAHVVKYLEDDALAAALAAARRLLAPGGRLVLWEISPWPLPAATAALRRFTGAAKMRSAAEIDAALAAAGFSRRRPFLLITPWLPVCNVARVAWPG